MITFMTHDQALMVSRFNRMAAIMCALCIIALAEYVFGKGNWIFTWIAVIATQILVVKCWADMIVLRQPDKNCWAFKEDNYV